MKTNNLTSLCIAISETGNVPDWVEVIPSGNPVQGLDGRSWINDQPQGILDYFNQLKAAGRELVFDFEHATELKAPNGEQAPASGWGIEMQQRENGSIWVKVDWNASGKNAIEAKEYRYLSPVLLYEKSTNRIVGIQSVALTNKANFLITALNQQKTTTQEKPMDLSKLFVLLGLPETATFDDLIAAITALQSEKETALNHAKQPPLDKFVPRGDYDSALNQLNTAQTTLNTLKQASLQGEIDTAINSALAAGKITPATKDYHLAMCQQGGLEQFKKFVTIAPVIGGDGLIQGKPPAETDIALNAEAIAIAKMFGNSLEDLKKHNGGA